MSQTRKVWKLDSPRNGRSWVAQGRRVKLYFFTEAQADEQIKKWELSQKK